MLGWGKFFSQYLLDKTDITNFIYIFVKELFYNLNLALYCYMAGSHRVTCVLWYIWKSESEVMCGQVW